MSYGASPLILINEFHKRVTLNFFEYFDIINEIHVHLLMLEFHK